MFEHNFAEFNLLQAILVHLTVIFLQQTWKSVGRTILKQRLRRKLYSSKGIRVFVFAFQICFVDCLSSYAGVNENSYLFRVSKLQVTVQLTIKIEPHLFTMRRQTFSPQKVSDWDLKHSTKYIWLIQSIFWKEMINRQL